MSPAPNPLPCELWYEPTDPGSQSPILHDPQRRIPESLLKAWQRELDASVEQLRQDKAVTVSFQAASGDWPTLWKFEDHTEPRARIPRIHLVEEPRPRYASPSLRGSSKAIAALPSLTPARTEWMAAWLDDVRAALSQPATDHAAAACVDYAMESLQSLQRDSPTQAALLLFEAHLIRAIWNAQQRRDDERSYRLAIALQEVMHQSEALAGDDAKEHTAGSGLAVGLLSAIQRLMGDVLPTWKSTAAS